MKIVVITVSNHFMKDHPRSGEATGFAKKILLKDKKHTLRSNVEWWLKQIKKVQDGVAVLSIRRWTGKPYASKQEEICRLTKEDGVGVQVLSFWRILQEIRLFAKNDGLSIGDFRCWFEGYNLSKPIAIIHFTKMRYSYSDNKIKTTKSK